MADNIEAQAQIAAIQQQAAALVNQANRRADEANLDSIYNALGAAQTEAEAAQNAYASALGMQDFQMAAEAQRKLSRAEHKMLQLESGNDALEQHLNQPPPRPQPQMTVEQTIANMPLTSEERA
jgi:hypothetical protein